MPNRAQPTGYHPEIGWKTLLAYELALRAFTRNHPPLLSFTAFAGVSAIDVATLPAARVFTAADGHRIGYRCYEARSDVSLVLIHGAGCFGDQFHEIARATAQAGRARVHTLNMRGHGLSDGRRGHAVTQAGQIVGDVAAFIAALKAERPDDRIVVGGHSAGGGVALGVSRTPASELVAGYVFLAPFLGLGSPSIRPYFGGWVRVRGVALRALTLLNALGVRRFNDSTVIDFNMDACLHDPRFVKDWSFDTMLAFGPGRWLAAAPAITAEKPVLLLAGVKDQCFFQPHYRDAFQVVAPHAEMPALGLSGHWDLLVNAGALGALAAWLDRRFANTFAADERKGLQHEAAA